jgi:hypothetical protein
MQVPRLIAFAASILAILAAVAALATEGASGNTRYDPMTALTTLTTLTLIWYTFYTRETLEHARASILETRSIERENIKRERETFATATMADIQPLVIWLRNTCEQGTFADLSDFPLHPVLQMAPTFSHYFGAETIHLLSSALSLLTQLQELSQEFQHLKQIENSEKATPREAEIASQRITFLASEGPRCLTLVHNCLVRLTTALINEGGTTPEPLQPLAAPSLNQPALLPDPFLPTH